MDTPDVEDLTRGRATASHVSLKPFVRMEWGVESRNPAQTDCELYEQEGL
jgi:hypothetical protein